MKLLNTILCTSLIAMPLSSHANGLKVVNTTKMDLSFKINNTCSESFGVVPSDTTKVISKKELNRVCEYNNNNCVAQIYSKAKCIDQSFAEIHFDTSYGVSYIGFTRPTKDLVNIFGNGFNLTFSSVANK